MKLKSKSVHKDQREHIEEVDIRKIRKTLHPKKQRSKMIKAKSFKNKWVPGTNE